MKSFIFIKTQFEGFHKYMNAPEEVSFLRDLHRHIFHVKVWIEVTDNDRQIEFILFKRYVDKIIKDLRLESHCSCEMICDILYGRIAMDYGDSLEIRIEVSEDDENGAYKEYGKS